MAWSRLWNKQGGALSSVASEGGPGSGNFAPGHKGVKGQRGGSKTIKALGRGGSSGLGIKVGDGVKLSFTCKGTNFALSNVSLNPRFGKKEIKNIIADCPRDGKHIAERLNNQSWIDGKFKCMGSGKNESGCTLSHTSSMGVKSTLNIHY